MPLNQGSVTSQRPPVLKIFIRVILMLGILAGVTMSLVGFIVYQNDIDLSKHPASTLGTIIGKSNSFGFNRTTGPQYYLQYSFRPVNTTLTYSNTLTITNQTAWQNTSIGKRVRVNYDAAKPGINYVAGYQSTPSVDRNILITGGILTGTSLVVLAIIWRYTRL